MGPFRFISPCLAGGPSAKGALVMACILIAQPCHGFAERPQRQMTDAVAADRPSPSGPAFHALPNPIRGVASWYGGHHAGKPTASGEIHRTELRTAAHRRLPFGTIVKVTNLKNHRVSIVRVNDRGPFVAGRTIDLSEQAARDLGMMSDGLVPVRLEILTNE